MNGLRFTLNRCAAQKTGIFLDQRENYLAAARHGHGEALDCFASSGGFAMHLGREVLAREAVDSASECWPGRGELPRQRHRNVSLKEANAVRSALGLRGRRPALDTVVLDPAGVRSNRAPPSTPPCAATGNQPSRAQLLGPGGILVTCSCSHHMSESMLLEWWPKRPWTRTARCAVLGAPAPSAQDHPILLTAVRCHHRRGRRHPVPDGHFYGMTTHARGGCSRA